MIRNFAFALGLVLLAAAAIGIHGCHKDAVREAARAADARAVAWQESANLWEDRARDAADDLAECTDLWQEAAATAEALIADRAEYQILHQAEVARWKAQWASRPQACTDLLVAMESACEPSLGRIE